jgi:probable F420-dependent oxidoreductase
MRFGAVTGNFGTFGADPGVDGCLAVAEAAERLGYDSVWVHDHVVMPSGVRSRYLYNDTGASPFRVDQHIYDPLTVMGAIAARTRRVEIGTSVLVIPYRNPLVLAKELATIDCISHGRVVLGAGVGWMAEEFTALGIDALWADRGRVTDEYLEVCRTLWTQDGPSSFHGRWVHFDDIGALPRPVRRPHIPIWIGGKTPAAFRRVARLGDGYHSVASTPGELAAEVAAVGVEMDRAGRDPASLEVSMLWAFVTIDSRQHLLDLLGAYRDAGLHHLVGTPWLHARTPAELHPRDRLAATLENLELVATEILPAVR